MHSIHIDYKQFEFIRNRGTSIISITDCIYDKFVPCSLIQIISNNDTVIAEVYKKYDDFEEVQSHQKDLYSPEIINHTNDNIWLKIFVYGTDCSETTALVPATLLLYRNIQWLRHLQLKKRFLKYIPTENTRNNFNNKIEIIEKTIAYLNGNIDVEMLCEILSYDKEDIYNFSDIIELLHIYPILPKLNNFRIEKLNEINNTINVIKQLYLEKKYLSIREAAYDIHNVPEFIRTLDDYRRA